MNRIAVSVALFAFALSSGSCSSEPEELDDPDVPAAAANPDGVSYPEDRLGGRKRTALRPGDRIPNFAFRGYPGGDRGAGLETISLADYYDPDQRRHKLLHLQVASTWCSICSSELRATVRVAERLSEHGIVFLEVIVSGATAGLGPSLGEVEAWMDRHQSNVSTAIDVRVRRLSSIGVSAAGMPHDILIDTRTMEILDSSVGAPADLVAYVAAGLRFVTENPPSY